MTRRAPSLGQMPLFTIGPVPVHIRRWSPAAAAWVCAWCRGNLAMAAERAQIGGCHHCPGFVEPAPPESPLTATDPPAGPAHLEREAA